MNPRATGAEVSRYLSDSEASAAIVLDRLWLGLEDAALPATLRHLVVADVADGLPLRLRIGALVTRRGARVERFATGTPGLVAFQALVREPAQVESSPVSSEDPAVLLYTGGTTGLPKAAVLTHRNLVANACQLAAWTPALDDGAEVMLSALPLVHGYAMTACMNVSILRGWTQVLVPDPRDIARLLAEVERWRVTVFPGVPTLYAAICSHPDVRSGRRDLSSIEACISGAATLPTGIQAEFERLTGGRLVEGYGLTEASPATHCNPLGERSSERGHRPAAARYRLPARRRRDRDAGRRAGAAGRPVHQRPAGHGRLLAATRGHGAGAPSRRRRPGLAAHRRRGRDVGRRLLPDRRSQEGHHRRRRRAEGLSQRDRGRPLDAPEGPPVGGDRRPVGGSDQRAKAFVVLRDGQGPDADEILAYLRERLAPYKVPKSVEFRTELPLAFTGKVLRRVLADEERAKETSHAD